MYYVRTKGFQYLGSVKTHSLLHATKYKENVSVIVEMLGGITLAHITITVIYLSLTRYTQKYTELEYTVTMTRELERANSASELNSTSDRRELN